MVIHASRGRPVRGPDKACCMIEAMTTKTPFTYYFSLDTDDPTLDSYRKQIASIDFVTDTIVADNRGCVQATNRAAERLQDENLMFVNTDDILFPDGWDKLLFDFIETIPTDVFLVHVTEGIPNSGNCAIIQCLSAGLYRKMGTLFHPGYISMFADNDILGVARALGAVYSYVGPTIHFIHEHPSFGYGQMDDTYRRTSSPAFFSYGERLFCARQAENFGVKTP